MDEMHALGLDMCGSVNLDPDADIVTSTEIQQEKEKENSSFIRKSILNPSA
jgi:hypothetical protein